MPRYYCDYCDIYLTHDSQSARKEHNNGRTHKANVRSYYQQFEAQRNQTLIDQKIKEHMGKVSAAYNHMRPYIAPFPTPMMPMNSQWMSGIRPPPMLPTPLPGYVSGPHVPPMMAPPGGGASHFTSQSSSYGSGIAFVPTGGSGSSTHSMANFVTYQSNTAASGGFDGGNQASEANRW